jgi:RimJ/RimL family protein N-acetyltransferase
MATDNLASIHVARKCGYVERERGMHIIFIEGP